MKDSRGIVGATGFIFVIITLYIGLIQTGPAKFFTAPNAKIVLLPCTFWTNNISCIHDGSWG